MCVFCICSTILPCTYETNNKRGKIKILVLKSLIWAFSRGISWIIACGTKRRLRKDLNQAPCRKFQTFISIRHTPHLLFKVDSFQEKMMTFMQRPASLSWRGWMLEIRYDYSTYLQAQRVKIKIYMQVFISMVISGPHGDSKLESDFSRKIHFTGLKISDWSIMIIIYWIET